MVLASLNAVTNAFRFVFTLVVSRFKSTVAVPTVVVERSNVTPVNAPEIRFVLELIDTPSMTAIALAAAWGGGGVAKR